MKIVILRIYLVCIGVIFQVSCDRNSNIATDVNEICDLDSIDIYCLIDNYYAPLNSIHELPVKLSATSHLFHFFSFESYDNPVFSFLKDSFYFSNSDFEFDGLFYDSIARRYYFRDDRIPFVWGKNRFKNIDFVCKNDIDTFKKTRDKLPFSESSLLFTTLFGKGYVYLSRPLVSKNKKLILIGEDVVNNTDLSQTPVYVFFKYSNKWHIRKFQYWYR